MTEHFEEEKIDKGSEDEEIEEVDIKACKFTTYGGDFSIRQLMDMIKEREIETPNIQRHYVWNNKIASRFIESVLLDLPLPSIFLAKNAVGKYVIVDGLQRLTSLYNYVIKKTENGKTFKLSTSKDIRLEWRGKSFDELLEEDQRKIKNKLIHAIIVEQKEPSNFDGLYLIFERINTGGLQLNQQEIRNAIFQNSLNDAINEINEYANWREMFGQRQPHIRMRDNEMILRFLALDEVDLLSYKNDSINMISLLNAFMSNKENNTQGRIEQMKEKFVGTIDLIYQLFGANIFRTDMQKKQETQKFYATIFDSVMIATSYAVKSGFDFKNFQDASGKLNKLFSDEEFKAACGVHTTDTIAVKTRVQKVCKTLYGINYERRI